MLESLMRHFDGVTLLGGARARRFRLGLGGGLIGGLCLLAGTGPAVAQNDPASTYYEFGTVVALGKGSIEVQSFDEGRQKMVQHTFVISKDSKIELLHGGDAVGVIYAAVGYDNVIRRIVVLPGVPRAGRAGDPSKASVAQALPPAAPTGSKGSGVPVAKVPGKAAVALPAAGKSKGAAKAGDVALPGAVAGKAAAGSASSVALPGGAAGSSKVGSATAVGLGGAPVAKVPATTAVPLGGLAENHSGIAPPVRTSTITREQPAEECNRSDPDWPTTPPKIAVLDFRYPTEREESHDVGNTGGGSGTALGDIVYDRLSQNADFAWSRGDRDKLYRADFAGAARLGRKLGVDAVLAGTFQPVLLPPDRDGFVPPVQTYELRAGLVDTCTGQLLMRLSSAVCPGGVDLGGTSSGCTRYSVTTKQTADPKVNLGAFGPALNALLIPLEHEGTPLGLKGSAGLVAGVNGANITVKLEGGAKVKVGDVVALHAWRLSKNPTTYTLHVLKDEEIGRVTVTSVAGGTATGTYVGDFVPKVGDTAELVSE